MLMPNFPMVSIWSLVIQSPYRFSRGGPHLSKPTVWHQVHSSGNPARLVAMESTLSAHHLTYLESQHRCWTVVLSEWEEYIIILLLFKLECDNSKVSKCFRHWVLSCDCFPTQAPIFTPFALYVFQLMKSPGLFEALPPGGRG